MSLPIYNFLEQGNLPIEALIEELENYPIQKAPIVIRLNEEEYLETIKEIENFYWEHEYDLKIPYPTYYIVEGIKDLQKNIFPSKESLPKFYKINQRSPGPMEAEVLTKISILQDKIINAIRKDGLQKVSLPMIRHKTLYEITKETAFYESLIELEEESHGKKE